MNNMSKLFKHQKANNIFIEMFHLDDNGESISLMEIIPNTTDGAKEKHVPVVTIDGRNVNVVVGSVEHPMLEEHYITGIYIETEEGGQFKRLAPGEEPKATFVLSDTDEFIAAYEHCNLHGTWKAS